MAVQVPRPLTVALVGLAALGAWLAPRLSLLPPGILAVPTAPLPARTGPVTPRPMPPGFSYANVPDDGLTAPIDGSMFYWRPPPPPPPVADHPQTGSAYVASGSVRAAPSLAAALAQLDLGFCYLDALEDDLGVDGGMVVAWHLEHGHAEDVRVVEDTTGDRGLEMCVASEVARWAFPQDLAGDVRWPFVFHLPGDRASSPDRAMPR